MIFKNICIRVLRTNVASALEGLTEVWSKSTFMFTTIQYIGCKGITVPESRCPNQGPYIQDLETGCPELAMIKFWGVLIFKGDLNTFILQP